METLKAPPTVEEFAGRVQGAHARLARGEPRDEELPEEIEAEARNASAEGDMSRALELWALLTDLDPWHAPWWHERGMTALRDGQERWGRWFLRRAAAVDPDYWPTRRVLATVLREEPSVSLVDVIRSACARLARGETQAARRALVSDLRSREPEEIAAVILAKVSAEGRW